MDPQQQQDQSPPSQFQRCCAIIDEINDPYGVVPSSTRNRFSKGIALLIGVTIVHGFSNVFLNSALKDGNVEDIKKYTKYTKMISYTYLFGFGAACYAVYKMHNMISEDLIFQRVLDNRMRTENLLMEMQEQEKRGKKSIFRINNIKGRSQQLKYDKHNP